MTIVAHSYRQWSLNENQARSGLFREGLVQGRKGYVAQQHHQSRPSTGYSKLTHPAREGCVWRGETLSQIHAFYWLGLWTPGGPLLMEPDGLLDTLAYPMQPRRDWPLCGSHPRPNHALPFTLASSLGGVGIGGRPPLPTSSSWAHPLVLHASRHPVLLLLLFFIHVIGWRGGCFNPGLIPGVSLWVLICNTPLGNEPFPDWHPESASRLWLCMQIHLLYLSGTVLSQHLYCSIFRPGVWKFVIILLFHSMCY